MCIWFRGWKYRRKLKGCILLEGNWNVRFIRDFNDWEMDEGLHFLCILGANTPPMDVGDRMRWKLKPNGVFDIRSY